jgi:hypothetical protein
MSTYIYVVFKIDQTTQRIELFSFSADSVISDECVLEFKQGPVANSISKPVFMWSDPDLVGFVKIEYGQGSNHITDLKHPGYHSRIHVLIPGDVLNRYPRFGRQLYQTSKQEIVAEFKLTHLCLDDTTNINTVVGTLVQAGEFCFAVNAGPLIR